MGRRLCCLVCHLQSVTAAVGSARLYECPRRTEFLFRFRSECVWISSGMAAESLRDRGDKRACVPGVVAPRYCRQSLLSLALHWVRRRGGERRHRATTRRGCLRTSLAAFWP